MRRALGLAILAVGMAGCNSPTTQPSGDSVVSTSPDFRATSDKFDFEFVAFIACDNGPGELVDFGGTLNHVFQTTISGNNFIIKFHDQPQGMKGVGETTGTVWNGTGVTQDITRSGKVGFTETFINNFKLIGPGPDNNFLVHENFHMTVNANGTVTVVHDNFTTSCK